MAWGSTHSFTFAGAVHEGSGNWLFGLDRKTGETRWFVHTGDGEGRGDFTLMPGGFEHLVELDAGQQISLGGKTLIGPERSPTEKRSKLVRIRGDASGTRLDVSELATITGFMGPIVRDRDGYIFALNVPGDCTRPRLVRLDGDGTVSHTRELYPLSCSQDSVHVSIGRLEPSPDGGVFVAGRFTAKESKDTRRAEYVLRLRLD